MTTTRDAPQLILTQAVAAWHGGFQGTGHVEAGELATSIDLPREFGGNGAATSPEDLLAAALASCYGATIGIILDRRQIRYGELAVSLTMTTAKGVPSKVASAAVRVSLRTDAQHAEVHTAIADVDKWCIVSGATKGNIEKSLEVTLLPLRVQESADTREATAP